MCLCDDASTILFLLLLAASPHHRTSIEQKKAKEERGMAERAASFSLSPVSEARFFFKNSPMNLSL